VSALAFTPSLFTLEWTHPPNREQPAGTADLLNTNSHSQYYSLQRSWIKLVRPLATLVYSTVDSGLTITYYYYLSVVVQIQMSIWCESKAAHMRLPISHSYSNVGLILSRFTDIEFAGFYRAMH